MISRSDAQSGTFDVLPHARVALNPIQWVTGKADFLETGPEVWLFAEPSFRGAYPKVLDLIKQSGFDAVMMEVLDTQTLQDYERMVRAAELEVAPGYCEVRLPEDHGVHLSKGSADWVRWFDGVRRKAEESNYFGLKTVVLSPELIWPPVSTRWLNELAVGADFNESRLERMIDYIGEAAQVLQAEGIRAGFHSHVGTWVETEYEIDRVLGAIDSSLLGVSFDVGHLAWVGMDPAEMIRRYADRVIDLHLKDMNLSVAAATRADHSALYDESAPLVLEPGLGDIDLDAVLRALPNDFAGWVIVEIDSPTMDPFISAQLSHEWIRSRVAPRMD